MPTYIALLRGINVSGHKMIAMPALRDALSTLPLQNMSTYIQSGNIIFSSDITDASKLEHQIKSKIWERFGFDVPVFVQTHEQLVKIASNNPFPAVTAKDPKQPYVSFLSVTPEPNDVTILGNIDFKGDIFKIIGTTMYICYADSAGNSRLINPLIDKKLKLITTSRNWKTLQQLISLSSTDAPSKVN